jgi:hypothetical protein
VDGGEGVEGKDDIPFIPLEKASWENGERDCQVCRMVMNRLKSYRDHVGQNILLPEFISRECVPGRSFFVKSGIKNPPYSGNKNVNGSTSYRLSMLDDLLGEQGLEFFVKPGDKGSESSCSLTNYEYIRRLFQTEAHSNRLATKLRAIR